MHSDRQQNGGCQGLGGWWAGEILVKGDRRSVLQDEDLQRPMEVMVMQQHECPLMLPNSTLKHG